MANVYVSNWGNDSNDGSTWLTAKKTLGSYRPTTQTVNIKGYFNEILDVNNIIGDPCTYNVIDGIFFNDAGPSYQCTNLYNVTVKNFRSMQVANRGYTTIQNCVLSNIITFGSSIIDRIGKLNNTLAYNMGGFYLSHQGTGHQYNTVICTSLNFQGTYLASSYIRDSIFKANYVYVARGDLNIWYNLFIGGSFRFTGGGLGADENTYTVPTGATDADKINNLRQRMATVYGGSASNYLIGCQYYSGPYTDIFVDPANADFHLIPSCLPAHMSYNADYIGARKEGSKAQWINNFPTYNNLNTNGTVTDQNLDASTDTSIIDIGYIRKITDIQVVGLRAQRNGQSINTVTDLDVSINAGSSVLTAGRIYQCQLNTVVIDNSAGTTLVPYNNYYAVNSGGGAGLGFTGTGVMREVLTTQYREKLQFKFHKTDSTLETANLITCYLHRDSAYVMVNVDGTTNPLYGDADPSYNSATAISLSARYWKCFLNIKANNLAAR